MGPLEGLGFRVGGFGVFGLGLYRLRADGMSNTPPQTNKESTEGPYKDFGPFKRVLREFSCQSRGMYLPTSNLKTNLLVRSRQ